MLQHLINFAIIFDTILIPIVIRVFIQFHTKREDFCN